MDWMYAYDRADSHSIPASNSFFDAIVHNINNSKLFINDIFRYCPCKVCFTNIMVAIVSWHMTVIC